MELVHSNRVTEIEREALVKKLSSPVFVHFNWIKKENTANDLQSQLNYSFGEERKCCVVQRKLDDWIQRE